MSQPNNLDASKLIGYLRNNPSFFIENYLKIRPKGEPLQLFALNPSQKIVVDIVEDKLRKEEPVRLMICKNRQVGMSTLSEALVFHQTVMNPSYTSLLVAPDRPKAQSLFGISQTFLDNMPDWLRPMRLYRTKDGLDFENPNEKERKRKPGLGSKMIITPANNLTAPRGLALSAAHLSEVPYWDAYALDLWSALSQSILYKPNTIVIMESTPNGRGDFFHYMYQAAKEGENEFIPIFLPWFIDSHCRWPIQLGDQEIREIMETLDEEEDELVKKYKCDPYQLKWRRYNIANNCAGDVRKFHFENPSTEEEAFALAGYNMFTLEARDYYDKKRQDGTRGYLAWGGNPNVEEPFVKFREAGPKDNCPIEVFIKPKRDERYVIGVDPAFGMEHDYSAMVVLDTHYNVCATYYSNTTPTDVFVEEIVRLGRYYKTALIDIETTGPGNGMMYRLRQMYPTNKLARWEKWDAPEKKHLLKSIGFDATNRSVSAIDELLRWSINTKTIKTTSNDLIHEMLIYQYDPIRERGGAGSGGHDDLMRALGIALRSLEQLGIVGYATSKPTEIILPKENSYYQPDNGIYQDWMFD
jgi:hypothetical protein